MAKEISVVMVEPSKHPKIVKIKNDLDHLQAAVGGLIEIVDIEEAVCILCNEEGKLIGLEGNRRLYNDILVGTFYVCGSNKHGDLVSLNPKQQEKYLKAFWEPQSFTQEEIADSLVFEFIELNHEDGVLK